MITYKCENCGSFRREESEKTCEIFITKCSKCIEFEGKKKNKLFDKAMSAINDELKDET